MSVPSYRWWRDPLDETLSNFISEAKTLLLTWSNEGGGIGNITIIFDILHEVMMEVVNQKIIEDDKQMQKYLSSDTNHVKAPPYEHKWFYLNLCYSVFEILNDVAAKRYNMSFLWDDSSVRGDLSKEHASYILKEDYYAI